MKDPHTSPGAQARVPRLRVGLVLVNLAASSPWPVRPHSRPRRTLLACLLRRPLTAILVPNATRLRQLRRARFFQAGDHSDPAKTARKTRFQARRPTSTRGRWTNFLRCDILPLVSAWVLPCASEDSHEYAKTLFPGRLPQRQSNIPRPVHCATRSALPACRQCPPAAFPALAASAAAELSAHRSRSDHDRERRDGVG